MNEIVLIDGHAHLDELPDLLLSLEEAKNAGVKAIIAVGSALDSNKKTIEIASGYPTYVYPAIGYHPWDIKEQEVEANLIFIQDHLEKCVALGEIGLDYKAKVKKEFQHHVFGQLLELAHQYDKPVIIHCRYSHERAFKMIVEKRIRKAVFHWYSGSLELLDEIMAQGYFISATPALLYSPPHQAAIKKAPLDRILLETDTPVIYQGIESRPKHVWITLEQTALLKGLDIFLVAIQTTANARQFFNLP
ncbi:MAG: TatD family hydrolase [Candidatus Aminicenantes bacterium]|nr:TatD family hydrolase [Candidatus Aminicenantes bacterium]